MLCRTALLLSLATLCSAAAAQTAAPETWDVTHRTATGDWSISQTFKTLEDARQNAARLCTGTAAYIRVTTRTTKIVQAYRCRPIGDEPRLVQMSPAEARIVDTSAGRGQGAPASAPVAATAPQTWKIFYRVQGGPWLEWNASSGRHSTEEAAMAAAQRVCVDRGYTARDRPVASKAQYPNGTEHLFDCIGGKAQKAQS